MRTGDVDQRRLERLDLALDRDRRDEPEVREIPTLGRLERRTPRIDAAGDPGYARNDDFHVISGVANELCVACVKKLTAADLRIVSACDEQHATQSAIPED
jgi:hypothetical protein